MNSDCSYSWYYDEINDSSFYDEVTTVNKPTTRYFYDGQMACEENFAEIVPNEDPFFEVTRYGLGARGVDWIEKATIEDTSISFPIYDGHGNVIAQLGRTGSSYSLTQVKKYDVWGGVRSGALGPAGRYCGNLGHVSDDESGLIYMRARYYEPGSGRFVSEDPAMDGQNWFAYCWNDPVGSVDPSGKYVVGDKDLFDIAYAIGVFAALTAVSMTFTNSPVARRTCYAAVMLSALAFATALNQTDSDLNLILQNGKLRISLGVLAALAACAGGINAGSLVGRGIAFGALVATTTYSLMLLGALIATEWDER